MFVYALQLVQATAGKFNTKVHVEYEWNLRLEELDESDDDLDYKVRHAHWTYLKILQASVTLTIVFHSSPVPLKRIVHPVRRVSATHPVSLLMISSLCLLSLVSVISNASHTLHSPIRCTAFPPTARPLRSQMPRLCHQGMLAKVACVKLVLTNHVFF